MYQLIYHQALKTLKSSAVSSTYEPSEIILTARWSALCWRCIALHWGSDVLHWVSVSEPRAQIDLTTRLQNQCFVPRDVRRVPNPSHFTGCSELSLLVGKDLFLRKKGWWTRGEWWWYDVRNGCVWVNQTAAGLIPYAANSGTNWIDFWGDQPGDVDPFTPTNHITDFVIDQTSRVLTKKLLFFVKQILFGESF